MAVPPEAAFDTAAFHRLVARYDVFDCAGDEVAEVWHTRGERGAVVEYKVVIAVHAFALRD